MGAGAENRIPILLAVEALGCTPQSIYKRFKHCSRDFLIKLEEEHTFSLP
jgi:hypothetical protein